jgi:hypothetical protein
MRRLVLVFAGMSFLLPLVPQAESACCYFAAKDKDILQPAQKAFITWDPVEKVESFTVQPKFEGNADDFGMVIPTPSKPKLDEMPRDFFRHLAFFTILEPMDIAKYKQWLRDAEKKTADGGPPKPSGVKIIETGVVGNLDFKIIVAEKADGLYDWLKDNRYNYGGDEATLDFYIKKKWFFTVMKIDSMQMKRKPDGTFDGEITPTKFTFASEKCIYPLKITQISVKDKTEALFYVQAPYKMDLVGDFSYQPTWVPMWNQALSFAIEDKLTSAEKEWQKHTKDLVNDYLQQVQALRKKGIEPTTLEWAKKITDKDIAIMEGKEKFNRDVPKEEVEKFKLLKGHLQKDQFVTKFRKVFTKGEMGADLELVPAKINDKEDKIEYYSILPTSPP